MHIILGGTGHVGSALAEALLERNEAVTIVTHDDYNASTLRAKGARIAIADVHDSHALRRVFRQGRRLFLLNPPAAPSRDTDAEERRTLASILAALDGSGLEKVVAESTYGAQPGEMNGDLGILHDMEQALAVQSVPATIIRAAYYMSNWDASLDTAKRGVVHTMFPGGFKLPMVAPRDIGRVAAGLMLEPANRTGLHYVEGPEWYSSADVAKAFAIALQTPVQAVVTQREDWIEAYGELGFSDAAAHSYAGMTAVTLDRMHKPEIAPARGGTSLQEYVSELVQQQAANAFNRSGMESVRFAQ